MRQNFHPFWDNAKTAHYAMQSASWMMYDTNVGAKCLMFDFMQKIAGIVP